MAESDLLIQKYFPLLRRTINGHSLVYLDNAATSLKPVSVLNAMTDFYSNYGANIHRGIYTLAEEATTLYEEARSTVAEFIGACQSEIIFTKGATESINAVAFSWALKYVKPGDQIVVTAMEHHANFVPWQQCAARLGAQLVVIPVNSDGTLSLGNIDSLLCSKTKIVAVCQASNVLGTYNDISFITRAAHAVGAKVLIDGAQSVPHQKIDVHELGCDFFAFSGHKMMGPTGIGVLYIRKELTESMPPYQYGGGMVSHVKVKETLFAEFPQCFEAGTPPIAGAIGLAAAIKFMKNHVDFDRLRGHEAALCTRLIDGLSCLKKVKIYGPTDQLRQNGHMISFNIQGYHPHDVAAYCDRFGICIRAGLQCAHPLSECLGMGPSARVSMFAYNTEQDIERLLCILEQMMYEIEVLHV